ncbi:MAG: hypothetical protein L0287_31990 [Anaerolineae bacterium]|nr:hypothetical protein [Anaerolineae bacterium]
MTIMICILAANPAFSQTPERGYFGAYETLEMAMNNFKYFAGEIGYRFNQKNQMRMTILEVKLTERHLSSGWEAAAVDGNDVEGYFRGYEINFDRFFSKHWYVSANLGYRSDEYNHTLLDESLENKTMTIGTGIGYTRNHLFGIKHFYLNFSMPVRYCFNHLDETKLGETTIRPHIVVNNIWLFLGYKF